jgi:pimeloyl-ACP methyl ester carboxylesterase
MGIDLAVHHPERVKALVAFGATTNLEGSQQEFTDSIPAITVESLKLWLGNDYFDKMPNPERLPVIVEKVKTMWLTEPNFTAEELSAIKTPTLIMVGEHDDVVRPDHASAIASAIPGAQALILPGMNHMGVIEMPDVWNKAVLDFLVNK